MKKKLFLFTVDFPFGFGEGFLDNELPFLEKEFDVIIIPISCYGEKTRLTNNSTIDTSCAEYLNLINLNRSRLTKIYISLMKINYIPGETEKILSNPKRLKQLIPFISNAYSIKKWFLKQKYVTKDEEFILYSYWMNAAAFAISELKTKYFKNAYVLSRAHGIDLYEERIDNKLKYLPLRSKILKGLDNIYCISKNGKEYLQEKHPQLKDKIKLSYLGVKPAGVFPQKGNSSTFRIVSCSNIISLKRIDLIIKALSHLEIDNKSISWIHIGDGIEKNNLLELAKNSLKNIDFTFLGRLKNEEVLKYYKNNYIDLFITTSASEGLPVSIMEAMSFGIPVLATDVGGIRELVNEHTGKLMPANASPVEIANAIDFFIKEDIYEVEKRRNNNLKLWDENVNANKNFKLFIEQVKEDIE